MGFQQFFSNYGGLIARCLLIIVIGLVLVRILGRIVARALQKSSVNKAIHSFLLTLVRVGLLSLLCIIFLQTIGIQMTSIIAVLSISGLAVSLAVQDSLSNVAGGFILLFTRPFEVNDYVYIDGMEGIVNKIAIVNTQLTTIDNKVIYIPNGQVSKAKITNYSREKNQRLELELSLGYHCDYHAAAALVRKVIATHPNALKNPEPTVNMTELSSSAIKIGIRVWVKNADFERVKFDLLEGIKDEFDKNDVIPA